MSVIPIRRNYPGAPYQDVAEGGGRVRFSALAQALRDAEDRRFFFVKGVEVDYRFVITSTVKELGDLIASGELRRSEVSHG
jgi:hypothetical protein